jgi:hypothetical protein
MEGETYNTVRKDFIWKRRRKKKIMMMTAVREFTISNSNHNGLKTFAFFIQN